MKIIYFLTIPFKPPPQHLLHEKKNEGQNCGILRLHQRLVGGRGVTCSDILVEHYANMSSYMSYLTQTQPLSPCTCSKQNLHIEGLCLRLLESRRRFKTYFQSVVHLRLFMKRDLVSFLDLVPKLRPDQPCAWSQAAL